MTGRVTVAQLAVVPVKGMRLMPATELLLDASGAAGDRAFLVVDGEDGRLVKTSRAPKLTQVAPAWDPATALLTLRFPDGSEATATPNGGAAHAVELYNGRPVTGRLVDGPLGEALSDHLGRPTRLLALDPNQSAADDFPVTLMTTASLESVAAALGSPETDPRRFRMNITLDGTQAWEEHGWTGSELAIGHEASLRILDPVPRCVVTTRDPDDGQRDLPVLKALAQLHGKDHVDFGVWASVSRPGRVQIGDEVIVGG